MPDSTLDLNAVERTAVAIATAAGQILLARFGRVAAREKDDGTLVTEADHAADDYIAAALTRAFPDHALLSEERNTRYVAASPYTWVIDPLDGTTNFARRMPIFGVSMALLWHGDPVVGVLAFPFLHEVYTAIAGYGAYCNDEPIHTDAASLPDDQHLIMQCTRTPRLFTVKSPLKPRIMGSAAYHVVAVANGAALASIDATPKVWDLAAAYLILREAGGAAVGLDAPTIFPLSPQDRDYGRLAMPMLAAASPACLSLVRSGIERR